MIGSLSGTLVQKSPPALTVEVGGVGYELEAPMSTFYNLPAVGQPVRLLTHLVVREDAQLLYGFSSADERQLFRSLLRVSGVGPRIALAILSGSTAGAFAASVHAADVASLTRIPGVGRKIAERLIVEMRDRLSVIAADGHAASNPAPTGVAAEAHTALVALGYRPNEATRLLKNAGAGGSVEEIIRGALQSAARE
jgi:holliday junction DNA helicase RuvA